MSSVRLWAWQVERMRGKDCPMSLILETAVRRWRAGEIVIRFGENHENDRNVLQLVAWRGRPGDLTDSQIRLILQAHFENPVDYSGEIARLGKEIGDGMGKLTTEGTEKHGIGEGL